MNKTTLAVLVILTVALAAWAGDTGLGTSPFTSGDQLTATAVNAMNDAINDNAADILVLEGYFVSPQTLEAAISAGAYASDILAATSEADFKSIVNLEIGTDVEAQVTEGSLTDSVIVSADIKDATIAAGDLNDTQDWSGKDITLAPYPTLTLELDDLSDSTSPHNIVENETRGFIISNGNASADAVLDFEDSALAEGRDFCVVIEAAYQITIEPDTDENWYLNGTQCGANDAIFNDDDTVGEMLCCISTERNMFCVSQDANWECE
jgi:hypothetical protein